MSYLFEKMVSKLYFQKKKNLNLRMATVFIYYEQILLYWSSGWQRKIKLNIILIRNTILEIFIIRGFTNLSDNVKNNPSSTIKNSIFQILVCKSLTLFIYLFLYVYVNCVQKPHLLYFNNISKNFISLFIQPFYSFG